MIFAAGIRTTELAKGEFNKYPVVALPKRDICIGGLI